MLGQDRLLEKLNDIVEKGSLPRFIIIVGEKGSQSEEIAPYIAEILNGEYVGLSDVKVDTVRKMVSDAYVQTSTIVYGINDADGMSAQAKNSLLKVTEEPPNKAYFVMTLEDKSNTLHTILSRATVYEMYRCMPSDILDYISHYNLKAKWSAIVSNICTTPGEADTFVSSGVEDFYNYVDMFVAKVSTEGGAESFILVDKISVKDNDGKYDMRLFFKIFQYICLDIAKHSDASEDVAYYCKAVILAGKYLKDLRIKGINRQMLIDNFILELRKLWK